MRLNSYCVAPSQWFQFIKQKKACKLSLDVITVQIKLRGLAMGRIADSEQ